MKKADFVQAIDEAIEAKEGMDAVSGPDGDRRKMDTVPMTALRRMSEIESLQSRNRALTARVRQLESELARFQSWYEGLNVECNEMMFAIQGAMPWMILLGDYIGNGTKDDPVGRCKAILAMHKAIGRDTVGESDILDSPESGQGSIR